MTYTSVGELLVCDTCGCLVILTDKHNEFHQSLNDSLSRISRAASSAQSMADPRHSPDYRAHGV